MSDTILKVENLKITFPIQKKEVPAVDRISFTLKRGKILGIVGESGCGKSLTALSLLRLVPEPGRIASGSAFYRETLRKTAAEMLMQNSSPAGELSSYENIDETVPLESEGIDLFRLSEKQMRQIRGHKISMIFQEPMTSLNPVFTVGEQIVEAILVHQKVSKKEAKDIAIDMLRKVRIPDADQRFYQYPHQMSGGMRQRVMIAMALSCKPDILIADEPTTALDVTIQAQILELIQDLVEEMNMSVILITHDLGIVAQLCEEVLIMYLGMIIERGPVETVFRRPKHPYTQGLLRAIPPLFPEGHERLFTIPGSVPPLSRIPIGCHFADRCPRVSEACRGQIPALKYVGEGQSLLCLNY